MTPELANQWWEGVTDAVDITDVALSEATNHGLLYWAGVGVVIVGGVALARWGINKITGKNNAVSSFQSNTRNSAHMALAA